MRGVAYYAQLVKKSEHCAGFFVGTKTSQHIRLRLQFGGIAPWPDSPEPTHVVLDHLLMSQLEGFHNFLVETPVRPRSSAQGNFTPSWPTWVRQN
jgi:hypothetical protein